MRKLLVLGTAGILLLTACGNTDEKQQQTTAGTTQNTASGDIVIHAGDNMKFDLTEIRVKEGQAVKLTLQHTGKAPKAAMGHNFVLLAAGVSADAFAAAAAAAPDNEYIPAGTKEVIAHTRLLGGGESDHIEFTAPAKGSYEFLCSFPGHVGMMRGRFVVE